MKVLHISPQPPSTDSGGGLGVYQTIKSLTYNNYSVDYVGAPIKNNIICQLYNNLFFLEPVSNVVIRIWDVLHGITNSRYRAWRNLRIDLDNYGLIVLDFTKLDYVIEDIGTKPLIVKAHNIEFEYSKIDYLHDRKLTKKLLNIYSYKQEYKLLCRANRIMALTQQDIRRFNELYNIPFEKFMINGVCVEDGGGTHSYSQVKLLITGSLWHGANVKGIIWFINKVYSRLQKFNCIKLTIAGNNPTIELQKLCNMYQSIELIDSPSDMKSIFMDANVFVAPIFDGTGMKVKVAEALSYGLPVIGTEHAFIGYDDDLGTSLLKANTADEFIERINYFVVLPENIFQQHSTDAHCLYKQRYSLFASAKQWRTVIDDIFNQHINSPSEMGRME